jgi:hypothetical protein
MALQTVKEWLTNPRRYIVPVASITVPQTTAPVVPHGPRTATQTFSMWNPTAAQAMAASQPPSSFFAPSNGIVHV